MSNYLTTDTELTSVADAIRTKGGTSAPLTYPDGFVSAIGAISTGVQASLYKDVNFIDYDGTILHSYTASEFAELSALPENPTHEGLVAQGWNWALSDAKSHVASCGKLVIGQAYITSDGKTRIHIRLDEGLLEPYLGFSVNGTAIVEWGDGTTSTVTGSSVNTLIQTKHVYSAAGNYVIAIAVTGTMSFNNPQGFQCKLLRKDTGDNIPDPYLNAVQRVFIGSDTNIGSYAFAGCICLKSVSIPSSASIAPAAFKECYSLRSITIPSGLTGVPEKVAYYCHALETVAIPKSAKYFYANAFECCYSLINAEMPSTVTWIGGALFSNCYALSGITVPNGLKSIPGSVFSDNYGMAYMRFLASTPPSITNYAFSNFPTDCKIIVPYSADHSVLNAYKAATNYPDPTTYIYEEE